MKITVDQFNSQIFQIGMGNLYVDRQEIITEHGLLKMESNAKKNGISHITAKLLSSDKKNLNTLLQQGYLLADTLVQYFFDIKKAALPAMQYKCIIRDAQEKDLDVLKEIAGHSFKIDRFHSDQYLDDRLCDLYYERWIENSYYGFAEKVIVAEYNGVPVGFTTGKTYPDNEIGHLVLSAVSSSSRGLGVYTSMIHAGVSWILKEHHDLRGILVGTQLDNIAVQKAWIKLGFTVYDSSYVLQKYIGE